MDPGFSNIRSDFTGFYIWRIEKLKIVPVPPEDYGIFYNGDAYIIYACTEYGKHGGMNMEVRPRQNFKVEEHIHFWLGKDASQDEITVAAYKSVELDDSLGGYPVQHREVQGYESKRFLSYFKDGIRELQGGVSTGLSHVEKTKTPKLFIVKGKRQPTIRQLPTISWTEMNDGDVFVLDTYSHIFIWVGRNANRLERLQGCKFASKLKEENCKAEVVTVMDGEEKEMHHSEKKAFNEFLSIKNKDVGKATSDDEDQKADMMIRKNIKLHLCSDETGSFKVEELKSGPLNHSDLNSDDAFIVDNGLLGIWVWIGKRATKQERTEAMANAQKFIKDKEYPASTPITRVIDGGEPPEFKSLFRTWTEKYQSGVVSYEKEYSPTEQAKFDATVLHKEPKPNSSNRVLDDGLGQKEIYRVDNFDLKKIPIEDHGKFYSGDCYVILYTYLKESKKQYIVYFWLGQRSSTDERATAALKAVEIDDQYGGLPVQIRVVEGKEPKHFLKIFQGKLRVFMGGISSEFEGGQREEIVESDTYLMQVHGHTALSTIAIQVPLKASSLNTTDCFVLVSKSDVWIWMGKGATEEERKVARNICHELEPNSLDNTNIVLEGEENDVFWGLLGGRGPYKDEKIYGSHDTHNQFMPRLFHGSNSSGSFRVEEIWDFTQMDLVIDDVMLLDVGNAIYIWLGNESNEIEKKSAAEAASEYLSSDPSGRDKDIPIVVIKQGNEPPQFTGIFGAWDPNIWDNMVY